MAQPIALSYPAATRRLRLGMVGGGRGALVGKWHAGGARLSGRWDIVAGAMSSDPEVALASGRDWLFDEDRIYTDYARMAEVEAGRKDGIDAVAICTPNHTHRAIAEVFMAHGIDVICDKPIALSIEDCDAMNKAIVQSGVCFAVTHPYIYHPMVVQAKAMVAEGAIGSLRQVMVEYVQDGSAGAIDPANKQQAWRFDPATSGRSATTGDIGTHALQLMEFVTGDTVSKLRADLHVCGGDKPLEDTAFINFALSTGAPGAMWITQAAAGNACGLRLRIYGEKGGIEWDQENPEHLQVNMLGGHRGSIYRGHGGGMHPSAERMVTLPRGHGEALSDAWANLYLECAVAIDARRHGKDIADGMLNLPGIEDGTRGVRFVHAVVDSHEAGGKWLDF